MNFENLNEEFLKELAKLLVEHSRKLPEVEKNPWEGVKYAKCKDNSGQHDKLSNGRIYKAYIAQGFQETTLFVECESKSEIRCFNSERFIPVTKRDYELQLIEEAKERFGEIKNGDRFDLTEMGFKPNDVEIKLGYKDKLEDAIYVENTDSLELVGFPLYKQGKWAEKLEDAKVIDREIDFHLDRERDETTISLEFKFNQHKRLTNLFQIRLSQYMDKVAADLEKMYKEFNS